MNLIAVEDCLPNGGLPIAWWFVSVSGLTNALGLNNK
jgi:hypothetical protein